MIYLIDASVYVFRAYYSVPADMTNAQGQPTNAVYGFARFLIDLLRSSGATHAAVAFDESLTTSFRNEIYPEYKANREPAPDDLKAQFVYCRRFAEALGLRTLSDERFEADDLIGTLVEHCHGHGHNAAIVTRDKDLAQLVAPGDEFYDYASGKRYGHDDIESQFGTRPERIADYLALTGDSVDNIRGVPGIGKKTAAAIFAAYGSLDEVYDSLDELHALPIRGAKTLAAKLTTHRDAAYLARELTRVRRDVPLDGSLTSLQRAPGDPALVESLCEELGFGQFLRRQALETVNA